MTTPPEPPQASPLTAALAPGSPPKAASPLKPRDAATLILVERSGASLRILMGRRRSDLAFLPGKFVFPGGRVDTSDRSARDCGSLRPDVVEKLMVRVPGRFTPARAHALARAAIRETHEETGLIVGGHDSAALGGLSFVARAVTPPGRVRRYDTRFFLADAALITGGSLGGDGELASLEWYSLSEIRRLDIPAITRLVIEDVAQASRTAPKRPPSGAGVPYYYHRGGQFQRDLL